MFPDLVMATGQVFLTICALLMLAKPTTYVHPLIALGTAVSIGFVGVGLFMMSAPVSGGIVAVCGVAWLGIFTIRGRDPNLSR